MQFWCCAGSLHTGRVGTHVFSFFFFRFGAAQGPYLMGVATLTVWFDLLGVAQGPYLKGVAALTLSLHDRFEPMTPAMAMYSFYLQEFRMCKSMLRSLRNV